MRCDQLRRDGAAGGRWYVLAVRCRPLLVIALVTVLVAGGCSSSGDGSGELVDDSAPPSSIQGVVAVDVGENGHTDEPVEYSADPPAGGEHDPEWLACGSYDEPVRNENAVHALEHGAAWITYGELPSGDVAALDAIAGASDRVILSPYPDLDEGEVVVSSWGRQLHLDGADDPRLEAFLDAYVDSPDAPEPGASCA